MGLAAKVWARWRSDGLAGVAKAARDRIVGWQDARIDRRFGIDTHGVDDDLAGLGASGTNLAHAQGYEPVQMDVFARAVRSLRIEPSRYQFVDYGSGKGRALIMAAEAGFARMAGVEFAPALHEAAIRNVARYREKRPGAGPIELTCADAADYPAPTGDAVLFFYNPFDPPVIRRVISALEEAWSAAPADWIVVYRNPRHSELFDAARWLVPVMRERDFAIWRTRSPAITP